MLANSGIATIYTDFCILPVYMNCKSHKATDAWDNFQYPCEHEKWCRGVYITHTAWDLVGIFFAKIISKRLVRVSKQLVTVYKLLNIFAKMLHHRCFPQGFSSCLNWCWSETLFTYVLWQNAFCASWKGRCNTY